MSHSATQRSVITVEAVVFPRCLCGQPYPAHVPKAEGCDAYRPSRPIHDLGVISSKEKE